MADSRTARTLGGILILVLALVAVGTMVTLTVAGESRVGILQGVVVDREGRAVPGALVTVPTLIEDDVRRVKTDEQGRWRAARVPIGYHEIYAQRRGYSMGQQGSGSVREGRVTDVPAIQLSPASPQLNLGVMYPQTVIPGNRKRLYLSGSTGDETARIRFSIYPYDLLAARITPGVGEYENRQTFISKSPMAAAPVWSWERSYSTSELDGSFAGEPATPALDRPGTYIVVAEMGKVRAGDVVNVTRLALVVKRDAETMLAWTTDIKSGAPVSDAVVECYADGKLATSTRTGPEGVARLSQTGDSVLLAARAGDSLAMTGSYFYRETYGDDGLIYTDRPIYRPGHTVRVKGIFRARQPGRYDVVANAPLTFVVQDPEGRNVASISATTSANGTANASWTCPDESRLGSYRISAKVNNKTYDTRFAVDEYRKPEYAVEVNVPKPFYIRGDKMQASIRANYYFGAPVANAEVTYTVYRSRWYFWSYESEYESWFDSEFGDYGYDYGGYGEVVKEGRGRTDDNGALNIELDTSAEEELARWVVEARVVDATMLEVVASGGAQVVPADFSVQVEPEKYLVRKGEKASFGVKTLDWTGKVVPERKLKVTVDRRLWRKSGESLVQEAELSVQTDKAGKGRFTWTASGEGDFKITVSGPDRKGRTASGETDIWVTKHSGYDWQFPPDNVLTIVRDRKVYQPGGTARLLIRAKDRGAHVLLTVEGGRLFESHVLDLPSGSTEFELKLRPEYLPGVTVSCAYIRNGQMRSQTQAIAISPEESFLTVKVDSSKPQYKPGETATYTIQTLDSRGKGVPAEVSLGVVDESIYALRADSTPDIRKYFWGPRYTRVTTSSSIEDYYYGGLDKFEDKVRKEFPDTAFWAPDIQTDAQGRARVSFAMPDSLTTWRATARAVTQDTKVGSATHKCIVTKDLIVRFQAPRFFRERDRQTLGLIVHNYTRERKRVEVSLAVKGLAVKSPATRTVTIPANGVERVSVDIEVPAVSSTAVLTARARTSDRSASDAVEMTFPVFPHGARAHVMKSGEAPVQGAAFLLPDEGRLEGASLNLEFAPSSAGAIVSGLRYLAEYPWGCIEQTASSFLPDVVVKRAMDNLGVSLPHELASELPKMISKGMRRLTDMQQPDGSWGWYSEGRGDEQMTAYVLVALQEARRAGLEVSGDIIQRGTQWLAAGLRRPLPPRPSARDWKDAGRGYRSELERRAYSLMATAYAGIADRSLYAELWKRQSDLSDLALGCLGMTAAQSGWNQQLQEVATLLQGRKKVAAGMMFWSDSDTDNYWSGVAATGMAMRVLSRAGRTTAQLEPVSRWLVTHRDGACWNNTRETAMAVLALVEHLEHLTPEAATAEVLVNGEPVTTLHFGPGDLLKSARSFTVSSVKLRKGPNHLVVRRTGAAPIYWTGDLSYVDTRENLPAKPGYFSVTRSFRRVRLVSKDDGGLQEKTEPLKGDVRAGEILRMTISVTPKSSVSYAIIEAPLPSGFEVVNRERSWSQYFSGIEVHDERVGIFCRRLGGSRRTLEFDVRAEVPGQLHVMPTEATAMYAPLLVGRSSEQRLAVR